MAKYKLEEYDARKLREALKLINYVYNYHYGAPNSSPVIKRLETVIGKLKYLIKECSDNGGE